MQEILPPEKALRVRHDGWTAERQATFCQALAKSGSVSEACALVGKSTTSAYKARGRIRGFQNRWDDALAQVKPAIEAEVYRRAVEGWDEPVFHAGQQVGVRRRYSDALLRMMALRGTQLPEEWSSRPPMPIEEVQRVLLQRLNRMAAQNARRQQAERQAAREAAAAEADRMRAAGLCP